MSGSAPIQREIIPRITTQSSTTMTRSLSCRVEVGRGTCQRNTHYFTRHDANGTLQDNAEGR